jgi:hypothetical protein
MGRYDSDLLNKGNKKTTTVEAFYVKPLAVWVPHLLIKNHIPCCPHCKKNNDVDVVKARWINCPKILFGIMRHKYLDTMLYPCRACKKHFAGYNKLAMQLDANVYNGYFNFYLGHGYAVDEELYCNIIESAPTQSTANIAKRLKASAYKEYYTDYKMYLAAVGYEKISKPARKRQATMEAFCPVKSDDKEFEDFRSNKIEKQADIGRIRAAINYARAQLAKDVPFTAIIKDKDDHNVHGGRNAYLPGIGSTKIRRLMDVGITSLRQLADCDPDDAAYSLLPWKKPFRNWQKLAEAHYQKLDNDLSKAEGQLAGAIQRAEKAEEDFIMYQCIMMHDDNDAETVAVPEDRWKPPLFSEFQDKKGFNGRVLSKYRIDCIVTTVFNHRKDYMECKMQGVKAEILKCDFNYKIASKIRVWTKAGQSFSPFSCIVTIQNEDGQTVFWKALRNSESFREIEDDLIRLRQRLDRNKLTTREDFD